MNGEVGFACRLTVAARKALKGAEFSFSNAPYENRISFIFAAREKAGVTVPNPTLWYKKLEEYGVTEIFLVMPCTVPNRRNLGFVNTCGCTVFARFSDGTTSRFVPRWELDKAKKAWNVIVTEEIMANAPAESPTFKDNTLEFKAVLHEIKELAEKLGFKQFADNFAKGFAVLDGGELPEIPMKELIPDLEDNKLRLYLAADISDVFGAMGSWNDSPAAVAHQMGVLQDYHKLSDNLLAQNRYALMYAVNYC